MPTALLSFLHAAAFEDGYDHGVDLVLDSISSSAVRRKASAAFLGGDWTQSRMPAVRTAFTKLPEKEQTPEGEEKGIICGVATGDGHSDGRITCGIPMYREHQSGAPFILPLYMQPAATTGGGGGGGGGKKKGAPVAIIAVAVLVVAAFGGIGVHAFMTRRAGAAQGGAQPATRSYRDRRKKGAAANAGNEGNGSQTRGSVSGADSSAGAGADADAGAEVHF
mmetsp:Transcript_68601/g.113578  ORF Transcript_68601/g.113578 Transcript_68601/m.113578 type:complete len:222 (-) Transcript_68601:22-687(-)